MKTKVLKLFSNFSESDTIIILGVNQKKHWCKNEVNLSNYFAWLCDFIQIFFIFLSQFYFWWLHSFEICVWFAEFSFTFFKTYTNLLKNVSRMFSNSSSFSQVFYTSRFYVFFNNPRQKCRIVAAILKRILHQVSSV